MSPRIGTTDGNFDANSTQVSDVDGEHTRSRPVPPANGPGSNRWPLWRLFAGIAVAAALCAGYSLGYSARVQTLAELAKKATRRENWLELDAVSREWTAAAPDSELAWTARAEALRGLGDRRGVSDALGRMPRESSNFVKYSLVRGDLLLSELHDVPSAEAVWKDILRVDRLTAQAWQRLIYVYAMTLRQTEMMEAIRSAAFLEREPAEAYVYAMTWGEMTFSDGAVRLLDWTGSSPDVEYLEVALAIYLATAPHRVSSTFFPDPELIPGSLARVERCRKVYPHNTEILAYLIDRAMTEGDEDKVRGLLADARNDDSDARFWRFRGWLLELDRQPEEADRHYQRGLALHPLDWRTRQRRAGTLRVLGRGTEAGNESELALRGKLLGREVAGLATAADADERLMRKVLAYMTDCGEKALATSLRKRL